MLPAIRRRATFAFRTFDPQGRQEATHEVVCYALRAVVRLAQLGKLDLAYPTVLANYGIRQFYDDRRLGCRQNVKDVMHPHCRRSKGIKLESLDHFDEEENAWREAVVQDTRTSPVPDTVSFRVDFADWLRRLSKRNRHIAVALAIGNRGGEVARRFDVSGGRIAQLRRELAASWAEFRGEAQAARVDPVAA